MVIEEKRLYDTVVGMSAETLRLVRRDIEAGNHRRALRLINRTLSSLEPIERQTTEELMVAEAKQYDVKL